MKFSIVIVTYNRLELLKKCIYYATNQTYQAENIIIINNCSTDGTIDYLKTVKDEKISIYNLNENLGGAGGFSVGVEEAVKLDNDWIVLIDDDAILDKNFLEYTAEGIRENKDILACSGTVKVNNEIDTSHRVRIKNWTLYKEELVKVDEYKKENFLCDTASFCGLVINKELVKKIGIPQKEFFIWFDDTEYSLRMRKFTKILNINKAVINHESIMLSDNKINWKAYYGKRNRMVMINKHCGSLATIYNLSKLKVKCLLYKFSYIISKKQESKYAEQLYKDAISDYKYNNLGKNDKYFPKPTKK